MSSIIQNSGPTDADPRRPTRPVVVIGAGLMGAQIAVEFAVGGYRVHVLSRHTEPAWSRLDAALRLVSRVRPAGYADDARANLTVIAEPEELPDAPLVAESLPEDLEVKVSVLRRVTEQMTEPIVASNTSSLSVTELGRRIGRPRRTVGMHYWNPPLLMPLVEVISGEDTDAGVLDHVEATLADLGKVSVRVRKDVPGFIWNRLQVAVLREALHLVRDGVATVADIDTVTCLGLGRRWNEVGLFTSVALGGTATWSTVAEALFPHLCRDTAAPKDLADRLSGYDDEWLASAEERRDTNLARALHADHPIPSAAQEQR